MVQITNTWLWIIFVVAVLIPYVISVILFVQLSNNRNSLRIITNNLEHLDEIRRNLVARMNALDTNLQTISSLVKNQERYVANSAAEIATHLSLTKSQVLHLIKEGQIAADKIDSTWRMTPYQLEEARHYVSELNRVVLSGVFTGIQEFRVRVAAMQRKRLEDDNILGILEEQQ